MKLYKINHEILHYFYLVFKIFCTHSTYCFGLVTFQVLSSVASGHCIGPCKSRRTNTKYIIIINLIVSILSKQCS